MGTIGVGKSTWVNQFSQYLSNLDHDSVTFKIFEEPTQEWTAYGCNQVNLLELMYHYPACYSNTFQLLALLTKLKQLENNLSADINIIERHFYCQMYVFIPLLLENNYIGPNEAAILIDLINIVSKQFKPDLIIYLSCPLEIALDRISSRKRRGEECITYEYLSQIDQKYKSFLSNFDICPVITVDTTKNNSFNPVFADILKIINNL